MAKEIEGYIKLIIRGGAANPAPPVGPALGAKGVQIMDFCNRFNDKTKEQAGKMLPVVITVYKDKSFDFIIKTPPAAIQLMEAANVKKGSGEPNRLKVGNVTWDQVEKIRQDANSLKHRVGFVFEKGADVPLVITEEVNITQAELLEHLNGARAWLLEIDRRLSNQDVA